MRRARHEPVIPVAFSLCVPAFFRAPGKEGGTTPPGSGAGRVRSCGGTTRTRRGPAGSIRPGPTRRTVTRRGAQARRATPSAFAAAATAAVTASATRSSNGEGIT
ncbi:hypothetical protein GCM10017750_20050 [Streptomyces racemochromogenes]